MPQSDFVIVLRWWGTLFLLGAAAYPLTSILFSRWYDRGYMLTKAVGMATVTWIIYMFGMARILPFTAGSAGIAVGIVFMLGILVHAMYPQNTRAGMRLYITFLVEEAVFFAALLFWSWVKAHEPSIHGLEKFMDYGFMNSILRSRFFPPADMWYPPYTINYYYFGHLTTAVLTRLSGLDLAYTFNLMLATLFALCLTMSYAIGVTALLTIKGIRTWMVAAGGVLTAFLVTLAGNMQTIYAFTKGYDGDNVAPFWQLLWPVGEFLMRYSDGLERYWYANATRFIPYTIHEFPSYSFVVSDIHGHVLSIPFVLLGLALLLVFFGSLNGKANGRVMWGMLVFYGFLCGVLLMTNALDGPIYAGLFILLSLVLYPGDWGTRAYWLAWGKQTAILAASVLVASLPFLRHFTSFVHGIAVNCPPAFLANSHIGPVIFETVDKCQKSPLWMLWLLWGFFWFTGVSFLVVRTGIGKKKYKNIPLWKSIPSIWNTEYTQTEKTLVILFLFSVLLTVFPEYFYFKDIYPTHFRSNTMFKLGYQAFMLYSVVAVYGIVYVLMHIPAVQKQKISGFTARLRVFAARAWFPLLLMPQLFLVSVYPVFSVRSYFGGLKQYEGIWGLSWLVRQYPDNFAAVTWMNQQITDSGTPFLDGDTAALHPVLVEADGDSYTDYNQFSVFTGMPTIVGWAVHEWLWRGTYDVVAPRRDTVRIIYESDNIDETRDLLAGYHVRYVIVGTLEREKFTALYEDKFRLLGKEVFRSNDTIVYEIPEQ